MIFIPIVLVIGVFAFVELRKPTPPRVEESMVATASGAPGVLGQLARVEALRVVRHPAFLLGLGMFLFETWIIGRYVGAMHRDDASMGLFFFPLAGMCIIATSLGVLRSARDGTDELYGSLPASRDVRTGAHLLSAVGPFVVSLVLLGIFIAFSYSQAAFGVPSIVELLTGPVLIVCACIVGVASARLVPAATVGVLAIVAMGAFQGLTDHLAGPAQHATNWFAPWYGDGDFGWTLEILPRRAGMHLVYLAGLGGFAAAIAFVRHRRDRKVGIGFLVAGILIATGGIAQSRPYSDADWDKVGALVGGVGDRCSERGSVRYCVHPGYEPLIERWAPPIEGVLESVPQNVRARGLEVSQRHVRASDLWFVPAVVSSRLPKGAPSKFPEVWPDDGAIHPGSHWCGTDARPCDLALGAQAAAWSVGLPLAAGPGIGPDRGDLHQDKEYRRYDSSGQSRAAVALWLAARSTPAAKEHFLSRLHRPSAGVPDATSRFVLDGCEGLSETGTAYGYDEAAYAAQLLSKADDAVARVIAARWDELTDPRTPTATLAELFELTSARGAVSVFENC